jgi:heparan-alpha-glucosaminide N-acetyltransferase
MDVTTSEAAASILWRAGRIGLDRTRLTSLDVFRGLVMLLLIPDVYGGLSFYAMAARDPHNPLWSFLAQQFTHAQWSGCTIWDLVMPSFVFIIGVSIPHSHAARKRGGDPDAWILAHAVFRALALLVLGIELSMAIKTVTDVLWPFLLLALGLPIPMLIAKLLHASEARSRYTIETVWWASILCASGLRIYLQFHQLRGFALHDILTQVGLAYVFAFMTIRYRATVQGLIAFGILLAYWLAFLIYPLPGPGFDLASVGVSPGDEVFTGYFAHWNKNTNLAAAFDTWFLNLFPNQEPYLFNAHGYQTLNFIPTTVTMMVGVIAGEYLRSDRPRERIRDGLLGAGGFALVGGLLLGWVVCPIVKSIWTPSWTIFSAGFALIVLGFQYHTIDVRGGRSWTFPFIVVGRNPLLLYTLALHYRWWIVGAWRRAFGPLLFEGYWGPIMECVACGFSLWLLACVLYRLNLFIRI